MEKIKNLNLARGRPYKLQVLWQIGILFYSILFILETIYALLMCFFRLKYYQTYVILIELYYLFK
jgi:hypothetical protein